MSGIVRRNIDRAIGLLISGSNNVFVNGAAAVRKGDRVAAHGFFPNNHNRPVMVGASSSVFVNGIPVCRAGDVASCGHRATGSSNVNAG